MSASIHNISIFCAGVFRFIVENYLNIFYPFLIFNVHSLILTMFAKGIFKSFKISLQQEREICSPCLQSKQILCVKFMCRTLK